MNIQLKDWKVTNLNLTLLDDKTRREENSFNLETGTYFSDVKESNTFGVGFKVIVEDKLYDLLVEAIFNFELIDEIITEEFKLSSFPKVNGPAISFPYLRAYISNLTLQSGLDPVILPSINFVRFGNDDSSDKA